jgi:hypothetical protein
VAADVPHDEVGDLAQEDPIDEVANGAAEDQAERQMQSRLPRTAAEQVVHDEAQSDQANQAQPVLAAGEILEHPKRDTRVLRVAQVEVVRDHGLVAAVHRERREVRARQDLGPLVERDGARGGGAEEKVTGEG